MSGARRHARRVLWAPVLASLLLAACNSGGGGATSSASASADTRLKSAGATVQEQLTQYLRQVTTTCPSAPSPVVCLESDDRTLGGQVHDYANVLATGHGFGAPLGELTTARNDAQTLANSLEILGDAQPTQANYDQVLNNFDVKGAIAQLQDAVARVNRVLG